MLTWKKKWRTSGETFHLHKYIALPLLARGSSFSPYPTEMLSLRLFIALKLFVFHICIYKILYTFDTSINKLWYLCIWRLWNSVQSKRSQTHLLSYIYRFSDQVFVSLSLGQLTFSLCVYSLSLLWLNSWVLFGHVLTVNRAPSLVVFAYYCYPAQPPERTTFSFWWLKSIYLDVYINHHHHVGRL